MHIYIGFMHADMWNLVILITVIHLTISGATERSVVTKGITGRRDKAAEKQT